MGNVTAVNTTLASGQTDNQVFCYDEQDRLTWAGSTGTPPSSCGQSLTPGSLSAAYYTQSFSYDAYDRLTSGPLGSYTYGDTNHLHAATAVGSGPTPTYTASYDGAGNMVCRAPNPAVGSCALGQNTGQQLAYDAEGRLSHWQNVPGNTPDSNASFRYDGEGERVAQQSASSGTTTTTRYLLGGIEELTTVGSTTTLTKYYSVPGVVTAVKVGPTLSYLATDGLGSVSVALAVAGNATGQALYYPYGAGRYSSGSLPTARGYTGQYQDTTSGLDYYGARYYDPTLGQFTSADTVLDGLNRYAYVGGNPTTATDPSGHGRVQELQEGAVPVTIATRTPNVFDYAGDGWGNGIWVGTNTYYIGPQYGYGSGLTTGPSMYSALPGGGYWVLTPLPYGGYSGAAYYPGYSGYDYVAQTYAALAAAAGQSPQYVNMAILASLHSSQSSMTLWDWLDTGAVRGAAAQESGQSQSGPTGGTESHRQTQTGGGGSFGGGSFGSGAPPLGTGGTCEGGESFAADTLVATPSGEQPISRLRVGDQVEAYDPATGHTSVQTVQHVFIDHDSDRLDVTLAATANPAPVTSHGDQVPHSARHVPVGTMKAFARADQQANAQPMRASGPVREVVHTTARHPWLTADQVWVRAGTLALGERVVRADGSTVIVVGLRAVAGAGDMWELTVSQVHTFLVGRGSYVVHNCPPPNDDDDGRLRGRSSKRSDAMIRQIARMKRLNARAFGDYVESVKQGGEKGTLNDRGDFTWQELLDLADDFIDEGGGD